MHRMVKRITLSDLLNSVWICMRSSSSAAQQQHGHKHYWQTCSDANPALTDKHFGQCISHTQLDSADTYTEAEQVAAAHHPSLYFLRTSLLGHAPAVQYRWLYRGRVYKEKVNRGYVVLSFIPWPLRTFVHFHLRVSTVLPSSFHVGQY